MLVNLTQFQTLVPDTTVSHLDPGTLILYEKTVLPVSEIYGYTSHPNLVIKWVELAVITFLLDLIHRYVFNCVSTTCCTCRKWIHIDLHII